VPNPHYGGSLTSRGTFSSRPSRGSNFKRMALIEKLVRLDMGIATSGIFVPDADIARMIGRSVQLIVVARRSTEYLRLRTQIATGIALGNDATAKDLKEYRLLHFKEMLPDAIKAIADEMTRPAVTLAERKFKIELVKDFMDREGTFPKISRTDSHLKVEHQYHEADAVAEDLLSALDSPSAQSKTINARIESVLEANNSFSQSESLSTDKQEDALKTLENLQLEGALVN